MATFDTNNWPLIKIIFKNTFNEEEYDLYTKCFQICLNDAKKINKQISLILDVRNLGIQSPKLLYKQINFLIENDDLISEVVNSSIILISNSLSKTLIDFIFRFKKPKKPNLITDDIDEGMDFLKNNNPLLQILNLDLDK